MTQEALAEKIGVPSRYLQKVERGEVNVTVATLLKFAHALDVEVPELMQRARLTPSRPGRPKRRQTT